MRALLERFLALEGDPLTVRGFMLVVGQGSVVMAVGASLAAKTFVKNGFRWKL